MLINCIYIIMKCLPCSGTISTVHVIEYVKELWVRTNNSVFELILQIQLGVEETRHLSREEKGAQSDMKQNYVAVYQHPIGRCEN